MLSKMTKEDIIKMSSIPGTFAWIEANVDNMQKHASENTDPYKFHNGKIPAIELLCKDPVEKEVAYMIATSHEYKEPNTKSAIAFVKNYKWTLSSDKIDNLEGINKPVIKEKVFKIATSLKNKKLKPLITVDQIDGIRPQTPGKRILVDGHHRQEACKFLGIKDTPIYKGEYIGNQEKSVADLIDKLASVF